MALEILDPTAERDPTGRPLATSLAPDAPARIALMDINKPRGSVFLDELERLLAGHGHQVLRTAKPTFTKPAPADVRREIAARCDAVIVALADWGSCVSCGLRDVLEFEGEGRPAALVASSVFADAADRQSRMLGQPDARRVLVAHPIQDRTDAELCELAREAAPALLAALSDGASGRQ